MTIDLKAICKEVGVDIEDFLQTGFRDRNLVMQRRLVFYILRVRYGLSYVEMERLTGIDRKAIAHGLSTMNSIIRNMEAITKVIDFDNLRYC